MDHEEMVEEGGMRRNQLATRDKVSSSKSKASTETVALSKEKVNVVKQSSPSHTLKSSPQSQIKKGSFKTPEFVLDRSLKDEEENKKGKAKERAEFDLGDIVEIEEESSSQELEVLKVKTVKKKQLESKPPSEQRTPLYQRLYVQVFVDISFIFFLMPNKNYYSS